MLVDFEDLFLKRLPVFVHKYFYSSDYKFDKSIIIFYKKIFDSE